MQITEGLLEAYAYALLQFNTSSLFNKCKLDTRIVQSSQQVKTSILSKILVHYTGILSVLGTVAWREILKAEAKVM